MIEMVPAEGTTIEEMRKNFRKTDLYQRGDARLVWVNEFEMTMAELRRDLASAQAGPL